jgi:HlyD family secretion protein
LLDARTRSEAEARLATAVARNQQLETAVERAIAARDGALREAARGKALASESLISAAELERLELLARLSVRDVDAAELARRVALAEVHAARATLGQVQSGKGQTIEVVAPASGRILLVHRQSEGPVAAGTPLIDFGDPGSLELVIDVLSSDAARIRVGAPVRFRQWGETDERLGYVRLVEPAAFTHISALGVEEQRVNVIVSLQEPPSALGDGYRVEARILVWQGADVVVIPSSAVFRHDDDWATYCLEGGRAVLRRLKLGQRNLLDVEVTGGIDAGARVVLYPGIRIEAGARVIAR